MNYLQNLFKESVVDLCMKEFSYKNLLQVPKLEKIVLNMRVGAAALDKKEIESAKVDLTAIAGQKPVECLSKKAIAGFKLRENMPIGLKVTLRGTRMYDFLLKLIMVALPRVKDFTGLSKKSFDGKGNLSLGIKEQLVFPEIRYDKIDKMRGMDITICTSAQTDQEALFLLKSLGLPFRK